MHLSSINPTLLLWASFPEGYKPNHFTATQKGPETACNQKAPCNCLTLGVSSIMCFQTIPFFGDGAKTQQLFNEQHVTQISTQAASNQTAAWKQLRNTTQLPTRTVHGIISYYTWQISDYCTAELLHFCSVLKTKCFIKAKYALFLLLFKYVENKLTFCHCKCT